MQHRYLATRNVAASITSFPEHH